MPITIKVIANAGAVVDQDPKNFAVTRNGMHFVLTANMTAGQLQIDAPNPKFDEKTGILTFE